MRHFSPLQFGVAQEKRTDTDAPTQSPEPTRAGGNSTPIITDGPRAHLITWLVVAGIGLVIAVLFGTAMLIYDLRNRALVDNERELRNTALVLAEQIDRALQAVDLVQKGIIERMHSLKISSTEELEYHMSDLYTHGRFKDRVSGLPHVDAIALINAEGKLVNFSRFWPIPSINVADRDYFKALKSNPQLTSFVSEPVRNRANGAWTIYLARKFTGPNGEFLGLVIGAMELAYFEKFFGSIALGDGGAITLFRRDGTLLARYPSVESIIGRNYLQGAMFQNILSHANHDSMRLISPIDGQNRLVAVRTATNFPVAVVVSTTVSSALAGWHNEAKWLFGAGSAATLLIAAIAFLIARQLERKSRHSKQRLREQQQQLDTALGNMSQGLIMLDAKARVVLCNQRYMQMYGLSPEVVRPGITLRELVEYRKQTGSFLDDQESYCEKIISAMTKGAGFNHLTKTPDDRTIQVVNQPMAGGGWVATHEDITERVRTEQALEHNRAFLNQVIENVPSTIVLKNAHDFRYLLINRAGENYFGIPRDQMIGKCAHDILPKETADIITRLDQQILRAPHKIVLNEHSIERPDHDRRTGLSKRLVIHDEKRKPQYILAVVDDVTERRATEQQLQQAQKMEAIGQLTGGVAHDFNNLLTIIIGNLDLLLDDLRDDPAAKQKVDIVLEASLRGADLARQMLAFSRRQPLQPKNVEINKLVKNTATLMARTLGENITIDVRANADHLSVFIDQAQLESAIVNIAVNARDAMPAGGALTIQTGEMHLDANDAKLISELAPGDYVTIEITDTGDGMPPEVLARIFEPFFTTKPSGKGTGLGLSMVYGFMKQSNGHVITTSEVGKGTTFKLYLPRSKAVEVESTSAGETKKSDTPAENNKVILAVDDNPNVRATVVKQLRELGYQVLEAENAQMALEQLESTAKIDLLFTDIIMPGGLNGKQLARQAQTKRPHLKVLFTSGFPDTPLHDGKNKTEVGDALLSKPYRKHELAKAIREILDRPANTSL